MNVYCVEMGRVTIEGHAYQIIEFDLRVDEHSRLPADHAVLARGLRVLVMRNASQEEINTAMAVEATKYRLHMEPSVTQQQVEYLDDSSLDQLDLAANQLSRAVYLNDEIDFSLAVDIASRWQVIDLLADLADLKTRASQALANMGLMDQK